MGTATPQMLVLVVLCCAGGVAGVVLCCAGAGVVLSCVVFCFVLLCWRCVVLVLVVLS